jgi:hypothetical protein
MADYTIMVMGEALSLAVRQAAPRARLHIRLVREALGAEYKDGIRFLDGIVAPPVYGFSLPDSRSAELFRDRWVCLVDARHPVLDSGQLSLAAPPDRGDRAAAVRGCPGMAGRWLPRVPWRGSAAPRAGW